MTAGRPMGLAALDALIFECPNCGGLRLPDQYMRAEHICRSKGSNRSK